MVRLRASVQHITEDRAQPALKNLDATMVTRRERHVKNEADIYGGSKAIIYNTASDTPNSIRRWQIMLPKEFVSCTCLLSTCEHTCRFSESPTHKHILAGRHISGSIAHLHGQLPK